MSQSCQRAQSNSTQCSSWFWIFCLSMTCHGVHMNKIWMNRIWNRDNHRVRVYRPQVPQERPMGPKFFSYPSSDVCLSFMEAQIILKSVEIIHFEMLYLVFQRRLYTMLAIKKAVDIWENMKPIIQSCFIVHKRHANLAQEGKPDKKAVGEVLKNARSLSLCSTSLSSVSKIYEHKILRVPV